MASHRSVAQQRGFSLIEALIGFLVLGIGMLGVTQLESYVIGSSSDSHQRNAAVHMAQRKIEYFRAWQPGVAGKDFGDIGDGSNILVRVHVECLAGDALHSQSCRCGDRLRDSLERIAAEGRGVLLYLRPPASGETLLGGHTSTSGTGDSLDYGLGSQVLADLGVPPSQISFDAMRRTTSAKPSVTIAR